MTKKIKRNKVLLTGGHAATTALALIEEFEKHELDIYWIGATSAFEGKKIKTIEEIAFDNTRVKSFRLPTGKINRKHFYKSLPSLIKLPAGIILAFIYVFRIRPDVVLSFGGSVSIPVVLSARVLRKPIVIHEQTIEAGKANEISSKYADVIAVSRKESVKHFPPDKVVVIGNPVRASIRKIKPKTKLSTPPRLLVFGGSRGASVINTLISQTIHELLKQFVVHHITGPLDYEKQLKLKQKLPEYLSRNYLVYKVIQPDQMGKLYGLSDVIVSRSGANSVSEILIAKRPVVFIPIPWTYKGEQTKNAKFVEKLGFAIVLDQDKSDGKDLNHALQAILKNWEMMVKNASGYRSPDEDASYKLASIVLKYLK